MKHIKSVVVLVCICAVVALMLAVTNLITAPLIEANEEAAAQKALTEVMPNGTDFQKLSLDGYTLPKAVMEAYREAGGGYVVRLMTTGYGSGMTIMCGIDVDGTISGAVCLSSSETLGYEKTFGERFRGLDAAGAEQVDTVSGATMTTSAYRAAILDALAAVNTFKGGAEN